MIQFVQKTTQPSSKIECIANPSNKSRVSCKRKFNESIYITLFLSCFDVNKWCHGMVASVHII